MSTYKTTLAWTRGSQPFTDGKYSRAHTWRFDGGAEVPASSSPYVVKPPMSDESAVDPEEAFIASLASCHMLFFLDFARRGGFVVDSYEDESEGVLAKDAEGRMAMTVVTLRPRIAFSGKRPTREELDALHHKAHEACFIANSVKTEVRVEAVE
ncbi:MAG TPA: OsmC family protein [Usitatibacter sp.]|nr:OsmC family protein [Usitatibacter sp.]